MTRQYASERVNLMLISTCQINNYKSFKESAELKFTPGFNVIVGRNNVGKSALIEALSLSCGSVAHRSIETLKTTDARFDPESKVTVTLDFSPEEFDSIMARHNIIFVPNPEGQADESTANRFLEVVKRPVRFRCTYASGTFNAAELTGFGNGYGPLKLRLDYDLTESRFKLVARGLYTNTGDPGDTFARPLAVGLRERIYVFRAERLNVGEGGIGVNAMLQSNAQNLAEVLHLLQSNNPARFTRFNRDVSTVFPEIKQITVKPIGSGMARILVWSVDPNTEREDLV